MVSALTMPAVDTEDSLVTAEEAALKLKVSRDMASTEVFVTASQAGDFLELHPATVQRFAREGLIPAHPVAGGKRRHWRFLRSELADWLRARTGEKSPSEAS
jgi:excisionase family DNA binding protein